MALKLCRCLCVLLLSIVNKDLLFVIIESCDWRVAHEAEQRTYVVAQITKKKKKDLIFMVSFFAPEHINRQWSISRWWSMSGQVGQSVVFLVVYSRLCVCSEWETFGASLHCLQGWGFSICGIWAACVCLPLSLAISVWPGIWVRYFTEPFKKSTVKRNELNQLILDNNELFCWSQWRNFRVFWRSWTQQHPVTGQ